MRKYRNRRNIDYGTYLKFARIIGDHAAIVCPKVWDNSTQGVFENRKTNPNIQALWNETKDFFLRTIISGRWKNLSREDIEFTRSVCVIGRQIVQRLLPPQERFV